MNDRKSNMTSNKRPAIYWIYLILFFLGSTSVTMAMLLFENTVVDWKVPVIIFITTGFWAAPFTANTLKKYCKIENYFLRMFFNLVAFGGLFVGFLIGVNYAGKSKEKKWHKVEIVGIGKVKRRGKIAASYADVIIGKVNKRVEFPVQELGDFKFVEIETNAGLLGFEIIISKNLTVQ